MGVPLAPTRVHKISMSVWYITRLMSNIAHVTMGFFFFFFLFTYLAILIKECAYSRTVVRISSRLESENIDFEK